MKPSIVLIIFILGVTCTLQQDFSLLNDSNAEGCRKLHQFEDNLLKELQDGNYPEDENVKCFVKCWYEKSGFVSKEGEVQEDVIKKFAKAVEKGELLIKQLDKCKDKKMADCDSAYDFDKCLMTGMEG